MRKVVVRAAVDDGLGRDYFTVSYNGRRYDDAWEEEETGHIWFNGNQYEYLPKNSWRYQDEVVFHGMYPDNTEGTSYSHTSRSQKNHEKVYIYR